MNVAPANIQKYAIEPTGQGQCVVKTIKNINRKGIVKMKQLDAINMRIASKQTIDALKEQGLIYQGEDGELHVSERKNSTVPTDQS